MRTLARNKTTLWMVTPMYNVPLLDDEGFDTGETTVTYSIPIEVNINIFPSGGKVSEQLFGKDAELDMIAISNEIVLSEDALLFLSQPTIDLGTTYDYRVSMIKSSLNTHNYGLRNRT